MILFHYWGCQTTRNSQDLFVAPSGKNFFFVTRDILKKRFLRFLRNGRGNFKDLGVCCSPMGWLLKNAFRSLLQVFLEFFRVWLHVLSGWSISSIYTAYKPSTITLNSESNFNYKNWHLRTQYKGLSTKRDGLEVNYKQKFK